MQFDSELARMLSDSSQQLPPLWRDFIDTMNEGLLVVDSERRVVFLNRRGEQMIGRPYGEIRGLPCTEAINCPQCKCCCRLFEQGGAESVDVTIFPRSQGKPRALRKHARLLRDEQGRILGGIETFSDVTRASWRETELGSPMFQGIVSRSPQMWELFRVLECIAQNEANVLVEGESGAGKELVARAIHQLGPRRDEPFYAVNCATFTGSLLLSELFGHERGSFTGAYQMSPGKLELAGRGTLFLDEVSEIPQQYQSLLLRVIEDRHFERVGGRKRVPMQARIIAATNRRLREAVATGHFREDLYFRLRVIPVQVPPLRERPEDVSLLATHFATLAGATLRGKRIRFTDAALEALKAYSWPGNVRELRNLVEYLCFVSNETIDFDSLPTEILEESTAPRSGPALGPASCASRPRAEDRERAELLEMLERCRFKKQEAAKQLGIDRTTLWRKMRRFKL